MNTQIKKAQQSNTYRHQVIIYSEQSRMPTMANECLTAVVVAVDDVPPADDDLLPLTITR